MPRRRNKPPVKLKDAKRRRKEPSPEIVMESAPESPVESDSPPAAALNEDQLQRFMLDWPSIPQEEHDSILLGVLESAVEKVGFGDENLEEIYSFFINTIPIRGSKNQASAYVAFCSCHKASCFDIGELILKSLIRSMRLALTKPLDTEDLLFLVRKLTEYPVRFATLIEELALENHSVRTDHLRIPNDAKVLETATEIVPVGFKNALDLLENTQRIDVNRRNCVRQVKMILEQIFTSRLDLIRSHGRAVAEIVKKLHFCPASAVKTIKLLAKCASESAELSNRRFSSSYALTLIFVSYLDLIPAEVVAELPEIINLITQPCIPGTRMLKDILYAFREIYRNSICSDGHNVIQRLIMDKVIEIIERTDIYEGQLEIIEFLEDLKESEIPLAVHGTLCERAEGLGILNRVCAMLLKAEKPEKDATILRAIKWQVNQRNRKVKELKIENPKLFEYMRRFMA